MRFPSIPASLAVVAVGFLSGILSGLFGVGGAVVTTPGIRALGASATYAIGSTIPPILPSAISGTLRYSRSGLVDWRVAIACGASGSTFAVFGAEASSWVDAHLLMLLTAVLMAFTAYKTARGPRAAAQPGTATAEQAAPRPSLGRLVGIGAASGFFAGLLGIGGGVVMLPAFTTLLRLPVKRAVASSLAAVALLSVPALVTQAHLGHVDWAYALLLSIGVVPGAQVGAKVTIGVSERTVRILVGAFLGLLAVAFAATEVAEWAS